jgi:elongator complex protein 1
MYKETRNLSHGQETGKPVSVESGLLKTSKVNRICDAVLDVLRTQRSTNLQNIITANVCKSPPALDDGLLVVAQLMKEDPAMADKAVEHICFLADVNKLYENALGLYDLELALLVAQQSQKDPREYLPFMQNLQQMEELRRRFSIDDYLERYEKALMHLHQLDVFEELQTYTKKHQLYQAALGIYRYNTERHAILTALYAEHLESKSNFKEAALAYSSLHNYTKATSCYLAAGPSQWRETLFSALCQSPPVNGPALNNLATSLYDGLYESKDFTAAAVIQLDYLSSVENAARAYCKGNFFSEALHLLGLKNCPDLIGEVVDSGLAEAFASSTEILSDMKAQLLAQVPRIRELRLKALQDPLAFYEGERAGEADLPDDVSVAASSRISTSKSLFTRYTGKGGSVGTAGTGVSRATSKNRKREERKRARGKKGSVYEEEYLVNSVERLINRANSVREEVERLVDGLVRRGMWERARSVESALADVVKMCMDCIPEVFGTDGRRENTPEGLTDGDASQRPVGGDAVLHESVEARGQSRTLPVVKPFERLSLLGT